MRLPPCLPLAGLLLTSFAFTAAADDWPQWRGPKRNGISQEGGLKNEWASNGPPVLWIARGIGNGYSSVSVAEGRIYTMGDKGDSSFVVAMNVAEKGKIIWTAPVGKPGGDFPGTRATPTVDGGRIYALGQWGDLVCLQAGDGKEVWRKSLKTDLGGEMMSGWGNSESLLVDGEQVLCTPGGKEGTVAALDKRTGAVLWRSKDLTDRAAYSSIIAVELGDVRQYIVFTDKNVAGLSATDGEVLWRAARKGSTAVIPTPIYRDGYLFVTSGYGVGCNLFRITATGGKFGVEEVYANKDMQNHHGGVVLIGDHLYGHSDSKGWVCMEFKTGKIVWNNIGVDKGSVTVADGKLICRSEGKGSAKKSAIALVEASPNGYKELGRFDQQERGTKAAWPHPVVANGRLYIRDMDTLLCYDVKRR